MSFSVDKQESLKYVRSHCCGVVLEGQFHLLGGATKVPGERSDNVASDFHQVCICDLQWSLVISHDLL